MKIFVILVAFTSIVTCRTTAREKRLNKMQCDKLSKSLESKIDGPIYKLNAQFNDVCGDFYPTPKPVAPKPIDNDPRPIISFETFVRWMKTRYNINNSMKQRNIYKSK